MQSLHIEPRILLPMLLTARPHTVLLTVPDTPGPPGDGVIATTSPPPPTIPGLWRRHRRFSLRRCRRCRRHHCRRRNSCGPLGLLLRAQAPSRRRLPAAAADACARTKQTPFLRPSKHHRHVAVVLFPLALPALRWNLHAAASTCPCKGPSLAPQRMSTHTFRHPYLLPLGRDSLC